MFLYALGEFGYMIWRSLQNVRYAWPDRRRVKTQLVNVGVNAIPLVLIVGLFAGAIIAWQAAYQFKGMVSMSVLGGQVARVVFMEMAPVLVAMVMAGRVGASMAAELGTMVVGEQLDALRTLAIDPVRYLVLPRWLAMTLMMPLLNVFAIVMGLGGAFGVATYFLDISFQTFFQSVQDFFLVKDVMGGMIKSVIFGTGIAWIGCFMGLNAQASAQGVGKATIRSFVYAAVYILAVDFLLWIVLF